MDPSLIVPFGLMITGGCLAWLIAGSAGRTTASRLACSLALGPGLAAGVVSLAGFFSLFLGFGQLGRLGHIGIWLTALAAAAVSARRDRPGSDPAPPVGPRRWLDRAPWFVVGGLAVGHLWNYVQWAAVRPHGLYDGMAIWTYRALQWTRAGDGFPEVVRLMTESQPGYPLLLPGFISGQFTLWGSESIGIPIAAGWLFVIGLAAATYLAVARWSTPPNAALAVALLLSTPMIWRWEFAQSADLAVAYLALVAAHGLVEMTGGTERVEVPPVLTGFFLGLLVWTKNEGTIVAIALVATAVAAVVLRRERVFRRLWLSVAAGALPGVAATVAFKQSWVALSETGRYLRPDATLLLADPNRWVEIARAVAVRLVPVSEGVAWGLTWVVLIGLLVVSATRRRKPSAAWPWGFYLVVFLSLLALDTGIYLITPEPLRWHLSTSLDRLLIQIAPLLIAAVFIAARPAAMAGGADDSA